MQVSDKDSADYARECVRLANQITDPTIRESLMQLAREWMSVVMHESELPSKRH
jgi:hypothetical protein